MARTLTTSTIAKDLDQTVERRTRRVCIEVTVDGRVTVTAEQEDVTRLNGKQIGGPVPAGAIVIGHDEAVANPSFRMVQAAIAGAVDAKGQAIADEAAKAASDQADVAPVVTEG